MQQSQPKKTGANQVLFTSLFRNNSSNFLIILPAGLFVPFSHARIVDLFKRIKQNFPLKYFLGDNVNAIKIQIWAAFIADLLIKMVQRQLKKKWAFSNLSSIIRLHLMSYINLFNFLNNPDKLASVKQTNQIAIEGFATGFKT